MNNEINNNNSNVTNYQNNNYINSSSSINEVNNFSNPINNVETTQTPSNNINNLEQSIPVPNDKKPKKNLIITILGLIVLVILILFITKKINLNGSNGNNNNNNQETNNGLIKNSYLYTFTDKTLYVGEKIPDSVTTYTNYEDVVEASGYDMFIRHKIKNDVIVENSVGFVYNGNVYYLKGGDGGASYNDNKKILDNAFGEGICQRSTSGEYQCTIREPYFLQPNIEDYLGIVGVRGKDREKNIYNRVCSVMAGQSGGAECRG